MNNTIFCSVTLNPIKQVASSKSKCHEIKVSLLFRRWHEIHQHCNNPKSSYQEDHNIFCKVPQNKVFWVTLTITPEYPEMLEGYITGALTTCKNDFPSYVTCGVLSYAKAKVTQYLRENIDFHEDLQGLRFEMEAVLMSPLLMMVTIVEQ
ncbi:hypothetical protein BVRB_7g166880 [Beta vulgaris subsp. vulgaris]|nr:hypothetical protein BVRB_7g166880 [Beta vulgaris subsp. vulgaris]